MLLVREFIKQYPGANVNHPLSEAHGPASIGSLLVNASSTFYPDATIFNGNNNIPTFHLFGTYPLWNGTDFEPYRIYKVETPTISAHADNVRNGAFFYKYIIDNNISAIFRPSLELNINDEYATPEKQAYLTYTYSHQQLPTNKVLDTLQAGNLQAMGGSSFNGKLLSYGHPAQPGKIRNLYIGDPNTATDNTHYQKLTYIIGQVAGQFAGSLFFSGNNTVDIPQPGSNQLTAYRCRDTAFWYRYFDEGDTLYNAFIRVPAYIDPADLAGYQLQDLTYNLGEGNSRSFRVTLHNPAAPIQTLVLNGFTDFTVAKNKVLHNVLLAHPVNQGVPVADTVRNCERSLLTTAIIEGRVRHQMYRDSIRNRLYNDFYAYVMNGGIQESLLVSYRNQRFNYTLYNYDRAGNLVATVPPAGVSPLPDAVLPIVDLYRQSVLFGDVIVPNAKVSTYKYNTLNQVYYQNTPDGGTTDFYYDAAGRVIFSQNDKQRPSGKMTYTLYDKQGRIFETGQAKVACPYFAPIFHATATTTGPNNCYYFDAVNHIVSSLPPLVTDLLHRTNEEVLGFVQSLDREEVVYTHYDAAFINLAVKPGFEGQENLRKRVSTIKYFDFLGAADSMKQHYKYAMHFSYDISGNVKTLTRDYPAYQNINQDWKRIDYDYDVISGKVNLLSYNRGFPDQYYQKYAYDADNRIAEVNTSNDGIIWQRDASYQYYQHGPLARMSLGDLRVQGVDYAYTIQGWLKAVNGDVLDPEKDMGEDAAGPGYTIHPNDAVALSLDYFNGDYKPIGDTAVTHITPLGKNLYNGNIPRATTSIIPFPDLKSQYTYDQLNRIVRADYAYMNRADATLTNTADYYSSYAYDPDGNLKKLVRNGNNPNAGQKLMDSLQYYYGSYLNYSTTHNKLINITEHAPDANYPAVSDITYFASKYPTRYNYDATGNVVKDLVSGQNNIVWNHYNKVAYDYNSQGQTMGFEYDGAGNRYLKSVKTNEEKDTTSINNDYYVRDAQGNILAIYKDESDYVMSREQWTEYITAQMFVRCGRWEVLDKYIIPLYGSNTYFKDNLFATVEANNPEWVQNIITDSPVSFYLRDINTLWNTVVNVKHSPGFWSAAAQWARDNGKPGLASANILSNETYSFLYTCFRRDRSEICGSLINLAKNYAPQLYNTMAGNFGVDPDLDPCDILIELRNNGYSLYDFSREMDALKNVNAGQYANYIAHVYDSTQLFQYGVSDESGQYNNGSLRGSDNLSFLQGMYVAAPNLFPMVLSYLGFEPAYDYEMDMQALYSWLYPYSTAKTVQLHEIFISLAANNGLTDEYARVLRSLGNNTSFIPDVLQKRIIRHLLTAMPERFNNDLFEFMGLSYNADSLDNAVESLAATSSSDDIAVFTDNNLFNYIDSNYVMSDTDRIFKHIGMPLSIYSFIDSVMKDPVVMGNSFYSGTFGVLSDVLNNALSSGLFNENGIGYLKDHFPVFMDQWNQGRTYLEKGNNARSLLNAAYQNNPATFIDNYITASGGNPEILTQSLAAIPGLTLNGFVNNLYEAQRRIPSILLPQWCLKTIVIDSIVHELYKQAQHHRRFSLASHILYGSSRLGTKDYLPGEYYKLYDNSGAAPIADTMTLASLRPWYSLEYNDQIAGLALQPYGGTDITSFYAGHQIGKKQYELSNHLGNVQATVSDLPHPFGEYEIERYHPALPATYDYYPFGMLMPERFTSDTTNKCMTITQTKWLTQWVDSCYDVYKWVWPHYRFNGTVKVIADAKNKVMDFDAQSIGSYVSFSFNVAPNVEQVLGLDIAQIVSGKSVGVELGHEVNGQWQVLRREVVTRAGNSIMPFLPTTDLIEIRIFGPCRIKVRTICVKRKVQVQQSYLVDVCSDMKDRYRFGFNGQEKVNEWAGIGNHNTAEFWEYDTRTGRRLNIDSVDQISISNYSVNRLSPIWYSDPNGDYSKFGAGWRNLVNGGNGIAYTKSTNEWGYDKGSNSGVEHRDGLSSSERNKKISDFKQGFTASSELGVHYEKATFLGMPYTARRFSPRIEATIAEQNAQLYRVFTRYTPLGRVVFTALQIESLAGEYSQLSKGGNRNIWPDQYAKPDPKKVDWTKGDQELADEITGNDVPKGPGTPNNLIKKWFRDKRP